MSLEEHSGLVMSWLENNDMNLGMITILENVEVTLLSLERDNTQPVFTCSKLTIEILEQGVKYVQS